MRGEKLAIQSAHPDVKRSFNSICTARWNYFVDLWRTKIVLMSHSLFPRIEAYAATRIA